MTAHPENTAALKDAAALPKRSAAGVPINASTQYVATRFPAVSTTSITTSSVNADWTQAGREGGREKTKDL
jgi:hypothetical protein